MYSTPYIILENMKSHHTILETTNGRLFSTFFMFNLQTNNHISQVSYSTVGYHKMDDPFYIICIFFIYFTEINQRNYHVQLLAEKQQTLKFNYFHVQQTFLPTILLPVIWKINSFLKFKFKNMWSDCMVHKIKSQRMKLNSFSRRYLCTQNRMCITIYQKNSVTT